jgi:beta-lactamase superfamily II metal-dependent hydrolase
MNIKVNILDVKDGDAIIIELFKPDRTLVLVIDGGEREYYRTKVKPVLQKVLTIHGKKAPDIVVCTHFDSDHIGGLIPLLADYGAEVSQVWAHKMPSLLESYITKTQLLLENTSKQYFHSRDNYQVALLLESLTQLQQLLDIIPPNKLVEAFAHPRPLTDWPEVSILGPTQVYFDTLFPSNKKFESFLREESPKEKSVLEYKQFLRRQTQLANINPCDMLKTEQQTKLSATNKASIILAVDTLEKRYLFTGDAGIDSLKNIANWQKALKDLYFLKVPHHASDNNLTKEIVALMQPVYAYSSGDKYQDDVVLECIAANKRNIKTKSTKTDGDLVFDSTNLPH